MSFLKKLFGGGGESKQAKYEAIEHNGFTIMPAPVSEGGEYRLGAVVTKQFGDALKSHRLIRADLFGSDEAANEAAIRKAKLLIDQIGDAIFDER